MSTRMILRFAAFAGLLVLARGAFAQQILRGSLGEGGVEGDGGCDASALSADGRFLAFGSVADNLVDGDTNGVEDLFVRDLQTGAIERVTVASSGTQANGPSYRPSLSADGRYVAFESAATNLVAGDTNHHTDIFVRDRTAQTTVVASVGSGGLSNGESQFARISSDGTIVGFASSASNLVAGDTNGFVDIFVRDLVASTTVCASVGPSGALGNGDSGYPSLASGGGAIAFYSHASNLDPNDKNIFADAFVHDLASGTTTRVSVSSSGAGGNSDSWAGAIAVSADGNVVAFESGAYNLVPNDNNHRGDVFVRDVAAGTTELASVATDGTQGDQDSQLPYISDDGARVVFVSASKQLVSSKTTGYVSAFLRDRAAGTTSLASLGCAKVEADASVFYTGFSADGGTVSFMTAATNLSSSDHNGVGDVYVNDLSFVPNPAQESNYGAGWPGTLGIPTLTIDGDPKLGANRNLSVVNSRTFFAVGFQLIGLAPANQPTSLGGTLLVDFFEIVPQVLQPGTTDFPITVPLDDAYCNVSIYLQELILDPGASNGFAFTPGLELDLGI